MSDEVDDHHGERAATGPGRWIARVVGVLSVAAGVIVFVRPDHSLVALAVVTGIFMLVDGIAAIVANVTGAERDDGVSIVLSVLGVVVGVLMVRHPIGGVTATALLLGVWMLATGGARLVVAVHAGDRRAGRLAVAGVLIVGGVLVVAIPDIRYGTLAFVTGISLFTNGVAMILVGGVQRGPTERTSRLVPGADGRGGMEPGGAA